jgi:23S rRNA maturation-related 3'-5' exoribonuclease YhaM
MNNYEIFNNEINLIEDDNIKQLVVDTLKKAPSYFYTMPASTTGKYHPEYTLGEGGLVRHTKAAVKIANDLLTLELYGKLLPHRDEILAALILHDSVKKGTNGGSYTSFTHPIHASELLKESAEETNYTNKDNIINICNYIESHMGQWNTNNYVDDILPKPTSLEQKFVHLCDYLASRKYINIDL